MRSVKELREAAGVSRETFADFFKIPYRTLQNWELELRECPLYVRELIEYKLRKENLIK